ncbi:hypothetical protein M885DRAFT_534952 [Pelagophyceae sp. CCMP2097]|nr:hypothetical protein M885DRAFT_534952 [Pelagophyceae sp. CCMP2097]
MEPLATRITGRLSYLTVQSNWIMLAYYAFCLLQPESVWVTRLCTLNFALGANLTVAYYALVYFGDDAKRKRKIWAKRFPLLGIASHCEHAFSLPAVIAHTTLLTPAAGVDVDRDTLVFIAGYILFYLVQTHVNYAYTGAWVYAVFDDVVKAGGAPAKNAFCVVLAGVVLAFGYLGKALLRYDATGG